MQQANLITETNNSSEKLFKKECKFVVGATTIEAIPSLDLPEFTFVGRSNVGKSSLINALLFRNSLARVSQNPGCTRQINFYNLSDKLHLVDLPGYGFARVGKQEKKGWDRLIHDYLRGRRQLQRAFILVDSRHPIKQLDIDTMYFLDDYAVTYQMVLTKIDKSKAADLKQHKEIIEKLIAKHAACHPVIIETSSNTGQGVDLLRKEMFSFLSN